MDSQTPGDPGVEARARRARAVILFVMAAFIALPIVAFLLFGRGSAPRP